MSILDENFDKKIDRPENWLKNLTLTIFRWKSIGRQFVQRLDAIISKNW